MFADGLTVNANAHFFSLARAANELKRKGSLSALEDALTGIPADFNPGGAVTTVAVRVALVQRNYSRAAELVKNSGLNEFNDGGIGGIAAAIDGYSFPKSWYDGLIARGRGDTSAARKAFEAARVTIERNARVCVSDEKSQSLLGLVDAVLGRKNEAVAQGRRATELLPIDRDAFDGPILATNLAVIYAQVGLLGEAITEIEKLVNVPNGLTPGLLQAEREWDPLREHPRFQALLG